MRRSRCLSAVLLLALLLLVPMAHAAITVVDPTGLSQLLMQYESQLLQYRTQLNQYANEIRMIEHQVRQIQHLYTQVQQGMANLERLADQFQNIQHLSQLSASINGALNQARIIGYTPQRTGQALEQLYARVERVLDGPDLRQKEKAWAQAQREAARIAAEIQSIERSQAVQHQRILTLAERARQARGNLEIQQVQSQISLTQASQLQSIEAQLATHGRMLAVQMERDAVLQEATQALGEQASQSGIVPSVPAGRVLPLVRQR